MSKSDFRIVVLIDFRGMFDLSKSEIDVSVFDKGRKAIFILDEQANTVRGEKIWTSDILKNRVTERKK